MLSRTNCLKRRTLLRSVPLLSALPFSTLSSLFSPAAAAATTSQITALDYSYLVYLRRLYSIGFEPTYKITNNAAAKASIDVIKLFGGPPQPIEPVDMWIDGPYGKLRLVVYKPQGSGPFPVTMYLHGGGWRVGSPESHDPVCRFLANKAHSVVVAVDYHLTADGYVYPVQRDECYAALIWLVHNATSIHGDARRLAVAGDSAGGNMATVMTLMARDKGGPQIAHQLLIYPVVDYWLPGTPSYEQYQTGYFLTKKDMEDFFARLLPHGVDDRDDPYLFPLRAPSLHGLPSASIIAAHFDVLRDEGIAYALRLKAAGVSVAYHKYPGIHTLINLRGESEVSAQAIQVAADSLYHALHKKIES